MFEIAPAKREDADAIRALYRLVAGQGGGLAREADEITESYVMHFVEKSLANGVILAAREKQSGVIIGEIHAYRLEPKVFAHVLGELTIAVHPKFQGAGVGKALFLELLRIVEAEKPQIRRVELIARESNQRAIGFYQRLGFEIEGAMRGRIASAGGGYEADIPMAWSRR